MTTTGTYVITADQWTAAGRAVTVPVPAPKASFLTVALTAGALLAFTANALLARTAMAGGTITPVAFAAIRLGTTALTLWLVGRLMARPARGVTRSGKGGSWISAVLLLITVGASVACLGQLTAATGALLFFGVVQATMFLAGLMAGERPRVMQLGGAAAAVAGLVYLMAPGLAGPSLSGSLLAVVAGGAWGMYSLRGRGARDPIALTTGNHVRCLPFVLPALLTLPLLKVSLEGALLAVLSGAVSTSLGSALWYLAVARLRATSAATAQLLVPVLTGLGGSLLLAERPGARLVVCGMVVVAGVALSSLSRRRQV